MSLIRTLTWPSSNENLTTIAPIQTVQANGFLQLNSRSPSASNPLTQGAVPFTQSGTTLNANGGPFAFGSTERTLSITAGATDLSGVVFTITGTRLQQPNTLITVTLNGPTPNATVETTQLYTQINSIQVNALATNVSAGFGTSGSIWVQMDYDRTGWYASCSAQVLNQTDLSYGGFVTLNSPVYPSAVGNLTSYYTVYGFFVPLYPLAGMPDPSTDDILEPIPTPVSYVVFQVAKNNFANVGESVIFTVLQQGIR